ncbi:MAG TPA: UDP-N-acetylglucosamine 2-epimerase (non-hydrolyzing) [Nocardioidaceae bacterium]|nr:UDP-N-acetylglucosamine 2-epimerase (non-hydrolyzing) [Nocardioidaceae bacterium]
MKILSVVGARPQFVKLAPISSAAAAADIEHVVVHTGQHYDEAMSAAFFKDLAIPEPDVNLEIGSASHGAQTGAMLCALEPVLQDHAPDWVLVYGDTNSTLAAAVCATKLHLRLAHLEAGLRSLNRLMPEEHNRVLTDHSADVCLAPTAVAMKHLTAEGLAARSVLVGDVMVDLLKRVETSVKLAPVDTPIDSHDAFTIATIHRPNNTDDPARLERILGALSQLGTRVYLAAHPRLVACADRSGIALNRGNVIAIPPLAYPQLVQALRSAEAVVTDSGGLQKEAFVMGVPTTTLRPETEWVETLANGWNVLAADPAEIASAVARDRPTAPRAAPYGGGDAAEKTLSVLTDWIVA